MGAGGEGAGAQPATMETTSKRMQGERVIQRGTSPERIPDDHFCVTANSAVWSVVTATIAYAAPTVSSRR